MKYKLTEEIIKVGATVLYRIQAVKDFGDVKTGDLGGFIESEDNLSQEGNAWVADSAKVFDNALVFGNAMVSGDERVTEGRFGVR